MSPQRDYLEWLGALLVVAGALVLFQLFALDMNVSTMKNKTGYEMRDGSKTK